jgi:hypothetical protein
MKNALSAKCEVKWEVGSEKGKVVALSVRSPMGPAPEFAATTSH